MAGFVWNAARIKINFFDWLFVNGSLKTGSGGIWIRSGAASLLMPKRCTFSDLGRLILSNITIVAKIHLRHISLIIRHFNSECTVI